MKGDHGIYSEGLANGPLSMCWSALVSMGRVTLKEEAFLSSPLRICLDGWARPGAVESEAVSGALGLHPAEEQLPAGCS